MALLPLARLRRLGTVLAIIGLAGLVLGPPVSLAHHHAVESEREENGENPLGGGVDSDCSLCLSISLNDGSGIGGDVFRVSEISESRQTLGPPPVVTPLAESPRSLPIRGPPVNA